MQNSGTQSGQLSRVVPVLACDRETFRLNNERLPSYNFDLSGFKKAFSIMERLFSNRCSDSQDQMVLQFSASVINRNYKATNSLVVSDFKINGKTDYEKVLNTMNDREPPNTESLIEEGSAVGRGNLILRFASNYARRTLPSKIVGEVMS